MSVRFILFIAGLFCANFALAWKLPVVKIDPDVRFQKIEYFAASDAWSGNFVGKYFPSDQKENIARWLFSIDNDVGGNPMGIGLSQWRFNAGGGTLEQDGADIVPFCRRAESFLTKDGGGYDWSKCAGQQYFMSKAKQYGCENFLIFSNTPPVQWTENGKGYSTEGKHSVNLKRGHMPKFAKYLADIAKYFSDKGYKVKYISPVNEPQVDWWTARQEGTHWRICDMYEMAKELDGALEAGHLDGVKMMFA